MIEKKMCIGPCGETKPLSHFTLYNTSYKTAKGEIHLYTGRGNICKTCKWTATVEKRNEIKQAQMNFEQYKGKKAIIKSSGLVGIIKDVNLAKGNPGLSARIILAELDDPDKIHKLMPHEIEIQHDPMMGSSY